MSSLRRGGGNRGGGGGGGGRVGRAAPKGLLLNGIWYCDCNPPKPAVHFETKKAGPNKGKWFRTCQKPKEDKTRCNFFLWDTDAHPREAAALANNSRTEPGRAMPNTPTRRQPQRLPIRESNRKRSRVAADDEEFEFMADQDDPVFHEELDRVMTEAETPSKVTKTSTTATPGTRRKLPWQKDEPGRATTNGLQTPITGRRSPADLFQQNLAVPKMSFSTPSKVNEQDSDIDSSSKTLCAFDTPTPSRFRDVANLGSNDDLVRDVFDVLRERSVRLDDQTEASLKSLLLKHAKNAEGLKRGRDLVRQQLKAKEAKITELKYRVNTLEAELEAERAMVKHLQWQTGNGPLSDT